MQLLMWEIYYVCRNHFIKMRKNYQLTLFCNISSMKILIFLDDCVCDKIKITDGQSFSSLVGIWERLPGLFNDRPIYKMQYNLYDKWERNDPY